MYASYANERCISDGLSKAAALPPCVYRGGVPPRAPLSASRRKAVNITPAYLRYGLLKQAESGRVRQSQAESG